MQFLLSSFLVQLVGFKCQFQFLIFFNQFQFPALSMFCFLSSSCSLLTLLFLSFWRAIWFNIQFKIRPMTSITQEHFSCWIMRQWRRILRSSCTQVETQEHVITQQITRSRAIMQVNITSSWIWEIVRFWLKILKRLISSLFPFLVSHWVTRYVLKLQEII